MMGRPCPCCGSLTMDPRQHGTYDICPVCWWKDDPVQEKDPTSAGGANVPSLEDARRAFGLYGAIEPRFVDDVRPPLPNEIPGLRPHERYLLALAWGAYLGHLDRPQLQKAFEEAWLALPPDSLSPERADAFEAVFDAINWEDWGPESSEAPRRVPPAVAALVERFGLGDVGGERLAVDRDAYREVLSDCVVVPEA